MPLGSWPAVTDDDGTKIVGTIFNKALTDAIRASIEGSVFSTGSPSVTAAAIIDEVIAARGSKASLDARLDVTLEEDGTPKANGTYVAATTYAAGLGSRNVALNGDMADWTLGSALAPDEYVLAGAGGTVARTGSGEADTYTFGAGTYTAKVTRAGADTTLTQTVISAADFASYANVKSQKVSILVKVKASSPSHGRITVNDGFSSTSSSYHTGGGTEETLTVLHTISSSATKLDVALSVNNTNGAVYFGGLMVVFADVSLVDWQFSSREPAATATRKGIVAIQQMPSAPKWKPGSATTFDARAVGKLSAQYTPVGNVGAGEDDMMTSTISASALGADGDSVRVTCKGRLASNGNNKRIRAYFGGTLIFDSTALWNDTGGLRTWKLVCDVIRTAAATQLTFSELRVYDTQTATSASITSATLGMRGAGVATAITLANSAIFKLTGEATADNDVAQDVMIIEAL